MPKEDDEVDDQEDEDKRISERAFRKSLKEYLERVAERNKRIKEEVALYFECILSSFMLIFAGRSREATETCSWFNRC